MNFRYLLDPLFVASVVILYILNRRVFEPMAPRSFFTAHLNDLICIPFCVPIVLFIARLTRLWRTDEFPGRGRF